MRLSRHASLVKRVIVQKRMRAMTGIFLSVPLIRREIATLGINAHGKGLWRTQETEVISILSAEKMFSQFRASVRSWSFADDTVRLYSSDLRRCSI